MFTILRIFSAAMVILAGSARAFAEDSVSAGREKSSSDG